MDNGNGKGLEADIEELEIDPKKNSTKKGNCHYFGIARINEKTIDLQAAYKI